MTTSRKPSPPSHLSRPAKRWWTTIVEGWEIGEDGLMVLQVALEGWDRLRAARQLVDKQGIIVTDPSGRQRAHPALQVEKESRLAFLRAWRQLNLDGEVPLPIGRPPGT